MPEETYTEREVAFKYANEQAQKDIVRLRRALALARETAKRGGCWTPSDERHIADILNGK